jgi:hypothetical protein
VTSPGDLVKRPYGGSNRRALNVGDILSRSGYTVETFGYANLKPGLPPMTILRSIPQWVRSLIHAIIRFKPDIVWLHYDRLGWLTASVLRVISAKSYKIVFDACLASWEAKVSETKAAYIRFMLLRFLEILGAADSEFLVAGSERTYRVLGRFSRNKLLRTNFILKQPAEFKQGYVRAKIGFRQEDFVLGVVGPFDSEFNRSCLAFLREHYSEFPENVKILVIGKYDARDFESDSRFVFVGPVNNYYDYLSVSNLGFVFRTVRTDGALNRILEFMYQGVPVLINDIALESFESRPPTPNEEVLCSSRDRLPDTIRLAVLNPVDLQAIASRGRKFVIKWHLTSGGEIENVITQVLSGRRSAC